MIDFKESHYQLISTALNRAILDVNTYLSEGDPDVDGYSDKELRQMSLESEAWQKILLQIESWLSEDNARNRLHCALEGANCPKCGKEDIYGDFVVTGEGVATQGMTCNDCGTTWEDYYVLSECHNVHTPPKRRHFGAWREAVANQRTELGYQEWLAQLPEGANHA